LGFYIDITDEEIKWYRHYTAIGLNKSTLNKTFTKIEQVTETDLIGALQMHEDGTANRFRRKGTTFWACNPGNLVKDDSVRMHHHVFECKKEVSNV
jgi:hypothetical protein